MDYNRFKNEVGCDHKHIMFDNGSKDLICLDCDTQWTTDKQSEAFVYQFAPNRNSPFALPKSGGTRSKKR
jgi:hypothetical protein